MSYLSGTAYGRWIVHSSTSKQKNIGSWSALCQILTTRFDTFNKKKIARATIARWRQLKKVMTFKEDKQKLLIDVPNITTEKQFHRYKRGLKPHIWKEMCAKNY